MSNQAERVKLTIITATKPGTLSKSFTLEGGTLQKHPGGNLAEGRAEQRTLSPAEFRDLLKTLGPAQALVYRVNGHDQARIVP